MHVAKLKADIGNRSTPPKSINVGIFLWQDLNSQSQITQGKFNAVGLPSAVFQLPVIANTSIIVLVDPSLAGYSYFVP